MNVDFVRFHASDGAELRGWLTRDISDIAVIHVHGMSGNGYENHFLDDLREMFHKHGVSFFTIDTRGSGVINSFWKKGDAELLGGSCYEIFDDCVFDIQGALEYLKTLGKSRFILMGHSLGASKVVHYIVTQKHKEIVASLLLAPTDMVGWANTDPNNKIYLQKAKKLLAEGKGDELVGAQCWWDKTPISAQTYPTICESGSAADIYGEEAKIGKIDIPTIIVYGDKDMGIIKIDGSIPKWIERVNKIKNKRTEISVIQNAMHSFKDHEHEVVDVAQSFLKSVIT